MTMTVSPYRIVPLNGRDGMFVGSIPLMTAISHEIENVVIENELPVDFYAGFQRFSHFTRQQERYEQLASICRRLYVWGVPDTRPPDIPNIEYISLSDDAELAREWFVVVDSPDFFTALLAQETTYGSGITRKGRHFEGIWTNDTDLVNQATWMTSQMLDIPYEPFMDRNYEHQSRYLAQVFTRLLQHREQHFADQSSAQQHQTILQSGLSSSDTPLLVLDARKTVVAASQAACHILGEDMHAIMGQPLEQCGSGIFAQRDPTRVTPPMMALLTMSDDDMLGANSQPITDKYGQCIGWVIRMHYVSHQRKRYQRRVLPIQPVLQQYSANLQHQLTALASLVEQPDKHQRIIAHTQRVVSKLNTQIKRMAQLQKLEAQGEIEPQEVHLDRFLAPIHARASELAAQRGIDLSLDIATDAPTMGCDPEQVQTALQELLNNLFMHVRECSSAQIRASHNYGYIHLSVQNNGRGVEKKDHRRVFEPFSRVQNTDTVDEPVGLGLEIVRAIARAHHGHLTIESAPGLGSTFTLVLPVCR